MDPLQNDSLGGFGTNAGAGFGVGNSMTSMGDIVIAPSAPPKKRFGKIIAIVVGLVVIIGGAVAAMTIINNQGSPKEEIYSALWNFYNKAPYSELVNDYSSTVGADFQNSDAQVGFFYSSGELTRLLDQELNSSQAFYEELRILNSGKLPSEQKKKFNLVIKNVNNVLNTMRKNIDILAEFYAEVVDPLRKILHQGDRMEFCGRTNEIDTLINSYTDKNMAEKYFSAYCEIVEFYNKNGDMDVLPEEIMSLTQEFANTLGRVIVNVDDYYNDEIEALLKYFEEPNEDS
ncbi:hypothetical protein IKF88_00225 [Candidatus Saccharibacteria bacterium]|nr:hypothetical protein [Candidatus Saccharibacteria bacterium]